MLQRKLSEDQGVGPELPPIVIETKKEKKRGGLAVLLISVGIGILALAGTALLMYVNSFSDNICRGE